MSEVPLICSLTFPYNLSPQNLKLALSPLICTIKAKPNRNCCFMTFGNVERVDIQKELCDMSYNCLFYFCLSDVQKYYLKNLRKSKFIVNEKSQNLI
jgi:hypothetical protein